MRSVRLYVANVPAPSSKPIKGPRRFLQNPKVFGEALDPEWRSVARSKNAEREAARLQHEVARMVRKQVGEQALDLDTVARATGLTRPQLLRKLRGEVTMSLIEIFTLTKETHLRFDWSVEPRLEAGNVPELKDKGSRP